MSTTLYFDYGGHYVKNGDGYEWISSEEKMYPLLFKKFSAEEISYSMLLDGVCKKVGIDSASTKLKLSFIAVDTTPLRQAYICDDDDVYVYLMSKDTNNRRSVLHVEVEKNQLGKGVSSRRKELENAKVVVSRGDQGSSVGLNYEKDDIPSEDIPCNALTLYEPNKDWESNENEGDSGEGNETEGSGSDEGSDRIGEEEEQNQLNQVVEEEENLFYEPPIEEEINQSKKGWEDQIDLEVGREFNNKKEVKLFMEKSAHKASFAFYTKKSDKTRYMLKCRLWKKGC